MAHAMHWLCSFLVLLATGNVVIWAKPAPNPQDSLDFLKKTVQDYEPEVQKALQQEHQDPEVQPGMFEGDMAGISASAYTKLWRVGLRWDVFPERKWPNATVPYHISHLYTPVDYLTIKNAIDTLSLMTCVKFVPYDGNQTDYLLIWPVKEPSGCWSFVGRLGGQQVLSLEPPANGSPKCLGGPGKAIHEIMHALGIFHEQSRADRDDYVTFMADNVIPDFIHNFGKHDLQNTTYEYDYDYKSIMHYGTHFFSTARNKPTLVPKKDNVFIGQREGLSKVDCRKINALYGCFDVSPYQTLKYETFCDILGL